VRTKITTNVSKQVLPFCCIFNLAPCTNPSDFDLLSDGGGFAAGHVEAFAQTWCTSKEWRHLLKLGVNALLLGRLN